jgi:hypothetical protein
LAASAGVYALAHEANSTIINAQDMILVFIGFNLNLKVTARVYTSKANSPATFHGLIPEKTFNKSTSFLRNVTR